MAFERAPIFKFDTPADTGYNEVPVGSMVMIESTSEIFTKNTAGGGVTPAEAIASGTLTANVTNSNIFNYLYYADEADSTNENPNGTNSRILGMNPITMKLEKIIDLPNYAHPGSCDRVAMGDKMYVRSATTKNPDGSAMSSGGGDRYMTVVDMVSAKTIKTIALNWKPRSSGAYNRYREMHAVTTKEKPWIHLIDCPTDKIIFSAGDDSPTYAEPQGNDGGNATGHAVWLDANHFALLDRMNVNIQVFRIQGAYPPYTVTTTQTIPLPSGCHSLRSIESGLLFRDTTFIAAIEGTYGEINGVPDSPSELWKFEFTIDGSGNGTLQLTTDGSSGNGKYVFSGDGCGLEALGLNDNIHHFGCATINGRKTIGIPLTKTNTVRFIDVETWTLTDGTQGTDLRPSTTLEYYTVGGGDPVSAGHIDFCTAGGMQLAITTNHKGDTVSVIDLNDKSVTEIPIPTLVNSAMTVGSDFVQSHANHVIGTNYYFFDCYLNEPANSGTFYEIDLVTKTVSRSTRTGGHPVQSFS